MRYLSQMTKTYVEFIENEGTAGDRSLCRVALRTFSDTTMSPTDLKLYLSSLAIAIQTRKMHGAEEKLPAFLNTVAESNVVSMDYFRRKLGTRSAFDVLKGKPDRRKEDNDTLIIKSRLKKV